MKEQRRAVAENNEKWEIHWKIMAFMQAKPWNQTNYYWNGKYEKQFCKWKEKSVSLKMIFDVFASIFNAIELINLFLDLFCWMRPSIVKGALVISNAYTMMTMSKVKSMQSTSVRTCFFLIEPIILVRHRVVFFQCNELNLCIHLECNAYQLKCRQKWNATLLNIGRSTVSPSYLESNCELKCRHSKKNKQAKMKYSF